MNSNGFNSLNSFGIHYLQGMLIGIMGHEEINSDEILADNQHYK